MINPRSKTHSAAMLIGIIGGLQTFLPTVQQFIDPEIYGPSLVAIGIIMIVLRNVTTRPINMK